MVNQVGLGGQNGTAGTVTSPDKHAQRAYSFTFADLFAGLGGFRVAGESVGGKCVFSSEIEPNAREAYRVNFSDWPSGDITAIQAEDVPDHDVLCGGFPCQTFSVAGKKEGFGDATRGPLFFEIIRIIKVKRPAAVFLENVAHLLKHDGGRTFAIIKTTLEDAGYVVFRQVLNASLYGAPTARKRIYIVCFRRDLGIKEFQFPEPTCEPVKLADVLLPDDQTNDYVVRNHPVTINDDAVAHANGATPLKLLPVGYVGNGRRIRQGYRVYSPNGHAVTFMRRGGGVGAQTGLYWINGKVRKLAPREMSRCMGFPDAFVIPPAISYEHARRVFGNSVVVPVVRRIFERICAVLTGAGFTPGGGALALAQPVLAKAEALEVVSLFSGCGGIDLGFNQAGLAITVANDSWEPAVATHRANFPGTMMIPGDITDHAIKRKIAVACGGRCDVLIGGIPCIAFTTSGNRDAADPRGELYKDFLEMVDMLHPVIAVAENVIGCLRPRKGEKQAMMTRLVDGLRARGYCAQFKVLCAADFGVPQERRRAILIAAKPGIPIRFPFPTYADGGDFVGETPPWRTVREAIGDLADAPEDKSSSHVFTRHGPDFTDRIRRTPVGQSVTPEYTEAFFRMYPDQPSLTIKGSGGQPIHYAKDRILTPREMARLQTFPDDFRFVGNLGEVQQQIGNAVPVGLARAVAGSVREMLDGAAAKIVPASTVSADVAVADVAVADVSPDKQQVSCAATLAPAEENPCQARGDKLATNPESNQASRLLFNGSSKKGPQTWAFSIAMPNGRCPFASSICSRLCYAEVGKFPLHNHRYQQNFEASKEAGFADRLRFEIVALAWAHSGQRISICAHEKGEFYSLDYLRAWGRVMRDLRSFPNVSFFIYTRSWVNPAFR